MTFLLLELQMEILLEQWDAWAWREGTLTPWRLGALGRYD
jgi:hypothetical protein